MQQKNCQNNVSTCLWSFISHSKISKKETFRQNFGKSSTHFKLICFADIEPHHYVIIPWFRVRHGGNELVHWSLFLTPPLIVGVERKRYSRELKVRSNWYSLIWFSHIINKYTLYLILWLVLQHKAKSKLSTPIFISNARTTPLGFFT